MSTNQELIVSQGATVRVAGILTGRMTIFPCEIDSPLGPRCATAEIASRAIDEAVSKPCRQLAY